MNAFNQEVGTRDGGDRGRRGVTAAAVASPPPLALGFRLWAARARRGGLRWGKARACLGLRHGACLGRRARRGSSRRWRRRGLGGCNGLERGPVGWGGSRGLLSASPVASSSREPCSEACPERAGGWERRGKGMRDAFGSAGRCHVNGGEWERRDVRRREGTERGCLAQCGDGAGGAVRR